MELPAGGETRSQAIRLVLTTLVVSGTFSCDPGFDEFLIVHLDVSPAWVCPMEPAELTWAVPWEEGCPGGGLTDGGSPIRCSSLTSLVSTPSSVLDPPVPPGQHSAEGTRTVASDRQTTFSLEGEYCNGGRCGTVTASEVLEVVPGVGAFVRTFTGQCVGARASWDVVDVEDLSACLRIASICTVGTNPGPIRLAARGGPAVTLGAEATCTDAFNGGGKVLEASPVFAIDPRACGDVASSGGPPDLAVEIRFECSDASACRP